MDKSAVTCAQIRNKMGLGPIEKNGPVTFRQRGF